MLAGFGALIAFAGFVILLIPEGYGFFRTLVGVPVLIVGALFCWLALRSVGTASRSAVATHELLPLERLALAPLAGTTLAGFLLLTFRWGEVGWVKVPVLAVTAVSFFVFAGVSVTSKLPERVPQPDIDFANTDD